MNCISPAVKQCAHFLGLCFFTMLTFTPLYLHSQPTARKEIEPATCNVKRTPVVSNNATAANNRTKATTLQANEIGYFNRITNLLPQEKILVELLYPQGKAGEQLVISVEDGGDIDG